MRAPGRQQPFSAHKPTESASPQPDRLEFTAGSDVSIVIKHDIYFVLGKSNTQSLVSIYYLFQSK